MAVNQQSFDKTIQISYESVDVSTGSSVKPADSPPTSSDTLNKKRKAAEMIHNPVRTISPCSTILPSPTSPSDDLNKRRKAAEIIQEETRQRKLKIVIDLFKILYTQVKRGYEDTLGAAHTFVFTDNDISENIVRNKLMDTTKPDSIMMAVHHIIMPELARIFINNGGFNASVDIVKQAGVIKRGQPSQHVVLTVRYPK